VIEPAGNVSEIGLFRANFCSEFDGFVEAEMCGVWGRAECVEYQHIESGELLYGLGGNRFDIGTIGVVADSKSQYFEPRPMM
jgi:hypothetical protein